jgi:hypothetical protein
MRNIRSTFLRFRLLNSVLVLVLMLVALGITPVVRAAGCDYVCSGWDAKRGCTTCNWCCVNAQGQYGCTPVDNSTCGLTGEELID